MIVISSKYLIVLLYKPYQLVILRYHLVIIGGFFLHQHSCKVSQSQVEDPQYVSSTVTGLGCHPIHFLRIMPLVLDITTCGSSRGSIRQLESGSSSADVKLKAAHW